MSSPHQTDELSARLEASDLLNVRACGLGEFLALYRVSPVGEIRDLTL